jgi:hypothetical protein
MTELDLTNYRFAGDSDGDHEDMVKSKKPKDNRNRAIFFINADNVAGAAVSAIFKIIAR